MLKHRKSVTVRSTLAHRNPAVEKEMYTLTAYGCDLKDNTCKIWPSKHTDRHLHKDVTLRTTSAGTGQKFANTHRMDVTLRTTSKNLGHHAPQLKAHLLHHPQEWSTTHLTSADLKQSQATPTEPQVLLQFVGGDAATNS